MPQLLVVYHSQSGSTAALARAVAEGAREETEVVCQLRRAADADSADMLAANAVLFGASENFGYLCGGMLDFLARVFYPLQQRRQGMPYGVFLSAGNDGRGALAQIERIAAGFPLRRVAEPLIVRGPVDEQALRRCNELGQAVAAGLALGIF